MPRPNKYTHEMARVLVCICCSAKLLPGDLEILVPARSSGRLISKEVENLLKLHVSEDFSCGNEKYPLSLCLKCEIELYQSHKSHLLKMQE